MSQCLKAISDGSEIGRPQVTVVRDIVSKAASCEEARSWPAARDCTQTAELLLKKWGDRLLRFCPDRSLIERRLRSLGLTLETALFWLAEKRMPGNEALPEWAKFLDSVLMIDDDSTSECELAPSKESGESDSELECVPIFPELARPFVQAASREIMKNADVCRWLSQSAIGQTMEVLTKRISSIAARTLAHEIKLRSRAGELCGSTPKQRYADFMNRFVANRQALIDLFTRYPVLARLLATRTVQTFQIVCEMANRLQSDATELSEHFNSGKPLTQVTRLSLGLSDPHLDGRSVSILSFDDQLSVVYKPRSLGVDVAYEKLVEWWNQNGTGRTLRCARVVSRDHYGWAEFIVANPCRNEEEITAYYERQGIHIALFQFLKATDFHEENFIASGDYPVPIDMECLLSATESREATGSDESPAFMPSALIGTGILPMWSIGHEGQVCSVHSGGAGNAGRPVTNNVAVWKGIGTDTLSLTFESRTIHQDTSPSLPRLDGNPVGAGEFIGDMKRSFSNAYESIAAKRNQLLDVDGPLSSFRGLRTRCLMRTTSEYAFLLGWSTSPDLLTSGPAHDIAFELLATYGTSKGESLDIIDVEKQQLWQRDIPVFFGKTDERQILDIKGKPLVVTLPNTSFDQMISALASASQEKLQWEQQILFASFHMACGSTERVAGFDSADPKQAILAEAIRLGESLSTLALRSRQGANWLTIQREPHDARALMMGYVDDGLYSGSAGIAVFLANLSVQAKQCKYAELAREALKFAVAKNAWTLQQWDGFRDRVNSFGSTYSTVYALSECGRVLRDDRLLQQAIECCEWQNPTPKVDNPDFINGAAGALCVLLHLHSLTGYPPLLERSQHLANSIGNSARQFGAWTLESQGRPLLGLGHGQVGIAMAMSRWATISGDSQWDEAIAESLAYEASNFDARHGDWPNLQSNEKESQFLVGWCGGAPGHGLARLDLLKAHRVERHETLAEVETAIAISKSQAGPGPENLCCGKPGTLWFLAEAGRQLSRLELCELASQQALAFISDRHERGAWYLRPVPERDTLPTLMGGIAGIGLSLLQVREPGSVSQVVTLS